MREQNKTEGQIPFIKWRRKMSGGEGELRENGKERWKFEAFLALTSFQWTWNSANKNRLTRVQGHGSIQNEVGITQLPGPDLNLQLYVSSSLLGGEWIERCASLCGVSHALDTGHVEIWEWKNDKWNERKREWKEEWKRERTRERKREWKRDTKLLLTGLSLIVGLDTHKYNLSSSLMQASIRAWTEPSSWNKRNAYPSRGKEGEEEMNGKNPWGQSIEENEKWGMEQEMKGGKRCEPFGGK